MSLQKNAYYRRCWARKLCKDILYYNGKEVKGREDNIIDKEESTMNKNSHRVHLRHLTKCF